VVFIHGAILSDGFVPVIEQTGIAENFQIVHYRRRGLLLPGEDIKFSGPVDVGGSYEAFQYRTLLACWAAMGVPYTNVTGDLRQANYS
jgi:capsid protein